MHSSAPLPERSLAAQLSDAFFSAKTELLVSSPYFVPGKKASERLCTMAQSGTSVRILTNSHSATDVPIAHAGYSKYRARLLKGGVELFEMRRRGAPDTEERAEQRAFGSANASLHAKSFVIDRERVFIGSLNLDPRSVVLNTEIGVLIDSPELAQSVARSIDTLLTPAWSYRLTISPTGNIAWTCEDASGTEVRFNDDPETSLWDRLKNALLRLLPIEDQI
jgi:putative cardiolipin synthase